VHDYFIHVFNFDYPKKKVDVYLQPLIEELKLLKNEGVLTYNISKKTNFYHKSCINLDYNDFRACGMLSSWRTSRRLTCPYCMNNSKSFFS